MRRFLFDWHLTLGKSAGALILIWSASGALMILDPIARRAFDAEIPKIEAVPVDGARFTFPVSRLPVDGASAVALRSFDGRSWYEARWPDGRVAGFDAATGAPVPAEIGPDEARVRIAKALSPGWTALGVDRLTANDDHYRPTDFPAYRLTLAGPGAPVLYLSSRDGSVLKTTTRLSRAARWLGMGVHAWNPEALKRSFDTPRRWALALLVALPLFLLAAVSYALLCLRNEGSPVQADKPKRVVAALVAAALIAGMPGAASAQALARVALPRAGAPLTPSLAVPGPGAPMLPASLPGVPALSVPPPALAAPALVAPVPVALAAAAVVPAAARPAAPRAKLAAALAPAFAVDARVPLEYQVSGGRAAFDGVVSREEGSPVPAEAFVSRASGLSAASVPERPLPPAAAKPAAPRGPDRKALWGIYVTHAAHLFTMSAAWRVAWPLLVIDLAGKASLAAIGSGVALVEMGTGLVAGMIVDRLLPRKSMAGAAVARAAIAVGLYAAASAGGIGFPLLFGAFLAHSFALTTIHIGQSSAAPAAAGDAPGALRRVNSTLKIVTAAVSIPGSLLGGWAVASLGVPGALLAYAAANLLVLAPLYSWLMPGTTAAAPAPSAVVEPPAGPKRAPGLWEAAKLIFTNKILAAALIAMAAGVVLVEPLRSTTLPILASDLSPASAAMLLGSFQAAFYAGQFAGNFGLLKWGERLSNRSWILLGGAGLLSFGLFALAPVHVAFAFAAAALIGLLTQPLSVVAKTVFQEEVRRLRPDLLGRAMGVNNLFYRLAVSAGTALVGWTAVAGAALALGATGTLAAVYGGVAVALAAAVFRLMRRPAPAALAAGVLPAPAAPDFRGSREIARDEAAEKLEAAGLPAMLAGQGLTMWHVLRHRGRGGEQVHLTFGLPPDGRPFERGGGDPARREELERRLESSAARITALVAETLGVDPASVVLHERLVEGCCGAGCQSCLLGDGESKHAKTWTGLDRGPAAAAAVAFLPLAAALPAGAFEWHMFAGTAFGVVALIYAVTGTISLLTQPIKSLFDPGLPAAPEVVVDPRRFPLSPAQAAEALTAEERVALKPGMPLLRAAAGSPQRRWYEFQTADGRTIEVHARTGRRLVSPRGAAFARGQVNRWLAGTPWKAAGPAKLVTVQGEYYRKGELPHYQADLEGPGGWQVFVSAKDGRILEVHSRLSRTLKWVGKGPHAWGIKALDKVDTLKRLLAPLLLGVPVLALAVTAFWLKASRGFPLELPALSDGAWAWHKFFGSWSLLVLLYMGVTGPLTLFMPIATKKLTPKLPKGGSLAPEAFVLSPSEAASRLPAGAAPARVQARSSRRRAWYEFELADGSRRAVSAADGSEVPVFMTAAEVEAEAREWLAGSPWTPKPGAVFLESHDSHYKDFREAEIPVYKLELEGPGGLRVYLSARDGRLTNSGMSVRSRLSRFLGTFVKSVHALEWGPFARHPNLRRVVMILFLTLPVALTVVLGLLA
ncbi:MAG: PepSY domain-containing protein [Elusimicrobia bacterium]|nr:PepSY domain-containing protein [Elusimicrobiota bacterium]